MANGNMMSGANRGMRPAGSISRNQGVPPMMQQINCPQGACASPNPPEQVQFLMPQINRSSQSAGMNQSGGNRTMQNNFTGNTQMARNNNLPIQNGVNSTPMPANTNTYTGFPVPNNSNISGSGVAHTQTSLPGIDFINVGVGEEGLTPWSQAPSITLEQAQYLNGFMRSQIGRLMTVEFLVGSNSVVERTGVLVAVGYNYIVLNDPDSQSYLACDFYNIKFVKVYYLNQQ